MQLQLPGQAWLVSGDGIEVMHPSSAENSTGQVGASLASAPAPACAMANRSCHFSVRQLRTELCSTFGPSLQASRGDPERRLTPWVPPCSRSVHGRGARSVPRCPRPSPAEGPRHVRQCRARPAGAAEEQNKVRRWNGVSFGGRGEMGLASAGPRPTRSGSRYRVLGHANQFPPSSGSACPRCPSCLGHLVDSWELRVKG
jgi:hypothetical protein